MQNSDQSVDKAVDCLLALLVRLDVRHLLQQINSSNWNILQQQQKQISNGQISHSKNIKATRSAVSEMSYHSALYGVESKVGSMATVCL